MKSLDSQDNNFMITHEDVGWLWLNLRMGI